MTVRPYTDDLQILIGTLPQPLQKSLAKISGDTLLEVVLDLGRTPQARLPGLAVNLAEEVVTRTELDQVIQAVGEFSADNRAGIEGTLHRISGIRNRRGDIVGLTLRVGRAVFGTIDLIRDLVQDNRSVLLLGRPGIGKTTKLREIARVMAEERRLYLIDEPTKGLAPAIISTMAGALRDLKEQGASILMVEQNFSVAKLLGDSWVVMDDGSIVWAGAMRELAEDSALQERLMGLSMEAV